MCSARRNLFCATSMPLTASGSSTGADRGIVSWYLQTYAGCRWTGRSSRADVRPMGMILLANPIRENAKETFALFCRAGRKDQSHLRRQSGHGIRGGKGGRHRRCRRLCGCKHADRLRRHCLQPQSGIRYSDA